MYVRARVPLSLSLSLWVCARARACVSLSNRNLLPPSTSPPLSLCVCVCVRAAAWVYMCVCLRLGGAPLSSPGPRSLAPAGPPVAAGATLPPSHGAPESHPSSVGSADDRWATRTVRQPDSAPGPRWHRVGHNWRAQRAVTSLDTTLRSPLFHTWARGHPVACAAHSSRCVTPSVHCSPPGLPPAFPLPSSHTPRVTFRRVVAPLRGPGQSPILPFTCCVGSLRSVGRCGRCSCWCRFRVRGAQWSVPFSGCQDRATSCPRWTGGGWRQWSSTGTWGPSRVCRPWGSCPQRCWMPCRRPAHPWTWRTSRTAWACPGRACNMPCCVWRRQRTRAGAVLDVAGCAVCVLVCRGCSQGFPGAGVSVSG